MSQLFANAARSLLMAGISAVDTSITVDLAKADLFPVADTGTDPVPTVGKDWFKVVLQDNTGAIEIIYVRTRTAGSASMTNCLRGQDGTTAIAFLAGAIVELRHVAADLADATSFATGASAFWKALVGWTTAALSRDALGSGAVGDAVFVADDEATALAAIGAAAAGPLEDSGITGASPRATRIDVATVAGVVNLTTGAPNTDDIQLTGTLQPTAFTVAVGRVLRVTVKDGFTLPNNAAIVTQTGTNIVASVGSTFMLRATVADVVEVLSYVDPFESVSATPEVPQTVLSGPVDSSGYAAFGGTVGSATLTTTGTLRATCYAGGGLHRVGSIVNAAFTSPAGTGTAYPHLEISAAGVFTAGVSTLPWVYQRGGTPSITSGQHTVNTQEGKVYVGNGSVATQVYRVCIGECPHTSGSWSGSPIWYALKRTFESLSTSTPSTTRLSVNHNLGYQPRLNSASISLVCTATSAGYAVGDEIPIEALINSGVNPIATWSVDRSTIGVITTSAYTSPYINHKTTGTTTAISLGDWDTKFSVEGW